MHGGPVSHIDTGRKTACDRHPADGTGLCIATAGGSPQFRSQATFDESPQWLAKFGRPLLGRDEQVVREIDGGLHMGKHIPVFMGIQSIRFGAIGAAGHRCRETVGR